jgi:hypothetical protein
MQMPHEIRRTPVATLDYLAKSRKKLLKNPRVAAGVVGAIIRVDSSSISF